ncbi:MAG TPA: hypothetical protein DCL68_05190 [Gammaproteobacteria bacterium]|nr:hypothetical protein [Gammaproteobacteria bacterium]|tara:strand:- start:2019 stop:2510 length:492 start_codon:yes stop_codon:yes gene_type:complete
MKKISFVIVMLISNNLFAESDLFGYWLTPGSIVLIENCDKHLCAKVETIFVEEGRDPKLILDENNKNKSLRSRTIVGINVLSGFSIDDTEQKKFKDGKIYDPRRGREFKSSIYLKEDGNLKVEGCLAFICDDEEWLPLVVTIKDDGTKEASLKYPPKDESPEK